MKFGDIGFKLPVVTYSGRSALLLPEQVIEPEWLSWAREIQAIAQTGLTFSRDPYDRKRYEALRTLSAHIVATQTGTDFDRVTDLFAGELGYATPKVDVRAAVFDQQHRLLMVRETSDGGRWTLPGGWADVNITPAENAVKETKEESGYDIEIVRLAAVWDRVRQGHPSGVFSCYNMFFLCEVIGGEAAISLETSEVSWFSEREIPTELSSGRVLSHQIRRMFEHHRRPDLATDYD